MSEREINNTYVVPLLLNLATGSGVAWFLDNTNSIIPCVIVVLTGTMLLCKFLRDYKQEKNNEKANS